MTRTETAADKAWARNALAARRAELRNPAPLLHFMHRGRRVESTSLKVLSDKSGAGIGSSSRWVNRIIRTEDGSAVAFISYNGRVWAGMQYVENGECLYDPSAERREAERAAFAAESITAEYRVVA